jgi:DNA-binding NarL/FixJ family response regulator
MRRARVGKGNYMTRILVADDNTFVRHALCKLVEQDKNWEVCAEAIDGGDAVQRAREMNPDLVVLDFMMPVMNGLQAAREILKLAPDVPILLCTAHLSKNLIGEAQFLGIRGAVSKSSAMDIVHGIEALLRHEQFF